ncbi:hypothetical protein, partial [Natronococcus jeotgali]|uniref:hypothetical protein n=1 Tax=Natronococcus jeotgali TaxID=413812 RepID=UPI001872D96D
KPLLQCFAIEKNGNREDRRDEEASAEHLFVALVHPAMAVMTTPVIAVFFLFVVVLRTCLVFE